ARGWLQLRDDLHRPHLRRAGDGAAGERTGEQVERPHARAQPAAHLRDEVVNVAEGFHLAHLRHANGTVLAYLPDVVAEQIDDHHVLGPVLRAVRQIADERGIFFRRTSARSRTLDRPRFYLAVRVHTQEAFRRRAQDLKVAEVEVSRERRRVERA